MLLSAIKWLCFGYTPPTQLYTWVKILYIVRENIAPYKAYSELIYRQNNRRVQRHKEYLCQAAAEHGSCVSGTSERQSKSFGFLCHTGTVAICRPRTEQRVHASVTGFKVLVFLLTIRLHPSRAESSLPCPDLIDAYNTIFQQTSRVAQGCLYLPTSFGSQEETQGTDFSPAK